MLNFFVYEIRYWLRSVMLWVFTGIVALMVMGALSSDQMTLFVSIGNTMRNAPYVIETYYAFMWAITLLMATAFVNAAATREFTYNMNQIIFTTPIRKLEFLVGRFLGAVVISTIPMMGISLGALLVPLMPWVDKDRFGPAYWAVHWQSVLIFGLPNTFFIAAIIFAIAALSRSTVISFLGGLLLMVADGIAAALRSDMRNEKLAAMLDPFGSDAFALLTKYWTVADRNTHVMGLSGILLWNRLLWMAVGVLIFAFACWRFSFSERAGKVAASKEENGKQAQPVAKSLIRVPSALQYGAAARLMQLVATIRIEYGRLMKTVTFIVITVAALLNSVVSLIFQSSGMFGLTSRPVTYGMLEIISGSLNEFLIAMITFFAGVLIWEERDARIDEVHDALPVPEWPGYVAKLIALLTSIASIQVLVMLVGISVQAAHQYTRFQVGLYVENLLGQDLLYFALLAVLAFFIHILSPNKYIGYFAFIGVVVANAFIWGPLHVASRMVRFASLPSMTYSDFFGYQPWITSWMWFALYWSLFCVMLAVVSILLLQRGRDTRWKARLSDAQQRFRGSLKLVGVLAAVGFIVVGGWVFYNTKILNHVYSQNDLNQLMANYEKLYKRYENLAQPRVQDVQYKIDIYPATREMVMHVSEQIKNLTAQPIDALHFSYDQSLINQIALSGAQPTLDDKENGYRIYKLTTPLAPGETRTVQLDVALHPRGFENQTTHLAVNQNGSFIHSDIVPQIGYQSDRELTDPNDRKRFGLPEKQMMAELERNCTVHCANTYISNNSDWVNVNTIISTSSDQTAIAPGSLVRQWQQDGRSYYEYQLDHKQLNFYAFVSGHYEVARSKWNGIDVEVYYLKEQPWNVPKMTNAIEKALAYYTTNYGPYYSKQARIIEFPRVGQFAQAFPGTMPYSESIGFIASIEKPDDIDMVTYVVAHEMAHQWWAHQVIGAKMQGGTLLSETLAQYSALMVMEKEYGRDAMRKFLEYEMDGYLRARGKERLKERPLLRVDFNQGYIHYQKGSVVMYYLREMIGEDAVNRALRKVLNQYGYQGAPYPTSYALVDALREQTPPQYQYLIKDLFEDITLFSNRATHATAKKRADGQYDVTVEVETHKYKADAKGVETEVPVDDWIEVGALAAPDKGKHYGQVLARQMEHMTGTHGTYTFTTKTMPDKAGIDPLLLLIDRIPDDNLKAVDVVN